MRYRLQATFMLLVAAVLAGCGAAPGSQGAATTATDSRPSSPDVQLRDPTPTPVPHDQATPSSGPIPNCRDVPVSTPIGPGTGVTIYADGPAPSIDRVTAADLVVTGTVSGILPSRLATPDCKWHGYSDFQEQVNEIITPVVLTLDGRVTLIRLGIDAPVDSLVIATQGGNDGGHELMVEGGVIINVPYNFHLGESVLLVLARRPTVLKSNGVVPTESGPGAWNTILKFTENPDGTFTDGDTTVTLDELIATLEPLVGK